MYINGLIVILCLIWGFNFVIMKLANELFSPALFITYRFFIGAAILLCIGYFKKISLPSRQELKWYSICGLLQTACLNIAIQVALNYIDAGLTSVLVYSMPLFVAIMAHFWIPGERLTVRKMIGIAIGIIGLFLAVNIRQMENYWAMLLVLAGAFSWALSNIIVKVKLKDCDNLQFTTCQMTVGASGLCLYSVCFESTAVQWNMLGVLYLLFAGVFASAFAFSLWSYILSKIEAGKAAVSLLLVPVIGVIAGCVFLNESLSLRAWFGILFVFAGVWLVHAPGIAQKRVRQKHVQKISNDDKSV